MPQETLTVTDNRTGKSYEIPIAQGAIKAADLRQIKTDADDFGLMSYDPAFMNTASTRSAITYIDGDKGILRYRGYPIEQLAEKSTYLETAYLILFGELPHAEQSRQWTHEVTHHTFLHENIKHLMETFRYDAHETSWPRRILHVHCESAARVVNASKTCVGSRRGTVSTWS